MKNTMMAFILGGLLLFAGVSFAGPTTPPFTQCPVIGAGASCTLLIIINPGGSVSIVLDPAGPQPEGVGGDDVTVGVQNNSSSTVTAIPLSSSSVNIFGFEGDGLCTFTPRPTGCPFGSTGYEGPNTSFTVTNSRSGIVNFLNGGIPPGGTSYFSLEGSPTAAQITVGPPGGVTISNAALSCTANAGVPPTVRAEGLTELVGDLVLNCTGGTPTAAGQPIAQANITVFLSTNITSRITNASNGNWSEGLLIIDEPHSASNPTIPLVMCDPSNAALGICSINGTGNGQNVYNGSNGPNVFQGRQSGVNQVTFSGVPFDPPGGGTRVIRITNIRGNANQLGVSSTLVPTQLTMYVSITGSTSVPINNPQQTVAFVQPGLSVSVRNGSMVAPVTFIQCNDANPDIAKDPSKGLNGGGQGGQQFQVRFDEGFQSAFKAKNIQTQIANFGATTLSYPNDAAQDIPGAIYNTESGFLANGVAPTPFPTNLPVVTPLANPAVTSSGRAPNNNIGVASQGTRLMIAFNSIPNGTQLFVPVRWNLTRVLDGALSGGVAVLTSTDSNGAGSYSAVSATNGAGLAPVSIFNGSGVAVYEILAADAFNQERLQIPVAVAFVANAGNNLPAPGVQSTVTGSFAPLSNIGTASDTAPIPRFAPSQTPRNSYTVVKCSCNILFPFVTNQQGYDTGIAIANTSTDIYGTTPQAGNVTLNYYSAGTPPPAQTTSTPVPGGQELLFTLSGGGNFGIAATPGFQGYIIAQSQFQFCHAYAFVSAQGALPTSAGASEGYLGIVLDVPGLNRTGQAGEVQAH